MNKRTVKFIDPSRNVVAVAHVTEEDGRYEGVIDLTPAPPALRTLFEEFEEIVSQQTFSFLDEIEEKITNLPLKAVLETGAEASLKELQVYPGTGEVSFKLAENLATKAKLA